MEQLSFFAVPDAHVIENVEVEMFPKSRSWFGFKQYQDAPGKPWRFIVTGFDGTTDTDGICSVLLADGGEKNIPIDSNNFITIRGKKYSRMEWDH